MTIHPAVPGDPRYQPVRETSYCGKPFTYVAPCPACGDLCLWHASYTAGTKPVCVCEPLNSRAEAGEGEDPASARASA